VRADLPDHAFPIVDLLVTFLARPTKGHAPIICGFFTIVARDDSWIGELLGVVQDGRANGSQVLKLSALLVSRVSPAEILKRRWDAPESCALTEVIQFIEPTQGRPQLLPVNYCQDTSELCAFYLCKRPYVPCPQLVITPVPGMMSRSVFKIRSLLFCL